MTTLINARPRFGLEGDRLFCYVTSTYIDLAPGAKLEEEGGVWDINRVAELIRSGATIESAFASRAVYVELQEHFQGLVAKNEELRIANEDLGAKLVEAVGEVHRLRDLQKDTATPPETAKPADKVEQAAADFNAATPPLAENDKIEQAKADFLSQPGENDTNAQQNSEFVSQEPRADVEGAMAPQEAPPKGD